IFFLPALRAAAEIHIYEQYQQIEAVSPTPSIARSLKLPQTAPVLLVKRVFVDADGHPVGLFRSYFRSDSYYYTVNLPKMRNGSSGQAKTKRKRGKRGAKQSGRKR